MYNITGKLASADLEFKGSAGFPVIALTVSVNGREIPIQVKGNEAEAFAVLLGINPSNESGTQAQAGTLLSVNAQPVYRRYQPKDASKPERTASNIEGRELFIIGTSGPEDASFRFQGVLTRFTEFPSRNGTIYKANLAQYIQTKDGPVVEAELELTLDQEKIAEFQAAKGKFVIVAGKLDSYRSGAGYLNVTHRATNLHVMEVPAWLTVPFADAIAAAEDDVSAMLSSGLPSAAVAESDPLDTSGDLPLF